MRKKLQNKVVLHHDPNAPSDEMPVSKIPKPISDEIVGLIVERASGFNRPEAFGAPEDVDAVGHETLLPALVKAELSERQPKVSIGSPQCMQPYEASLLNCAALSFGPMGKNFILALNRAARLGEFFQNTGEAGISPYHFNVALDVEAPDFDMDYFTEELAAGKYPESAEAGDVVWQLGTGYFGCRGVDGGFDAEQFRRKAAIPNVRMIEVKLSQGVEPRKEMPVKKVTAGMARIMGIHWRNQAKLQDEHSSFSSPVELLKFVARLRDLSGGKPIGLKIGISHRHYFMAICKAMLKTGILLDYITVDGMEAGTAASTHGAAGFTGTALNDAILFVHNVLVGTRLRQHIRIIASGRTFTEQDILSKLARGADLCATARGMMLAVGCDQQRECYNGNCAKGIATQDPRLLRNFDIRKNTQRLVNYHRITLQEVMGLLSIAGVKHPSQIAPFHIQKRISLVEVKTLDEIYEFIKPGSLLVCCPWLMPPRYRKLWRMANPAETFQASLDRQIAANTQPQRN